MSTDQRKIYAYPDTNCWRGEPELLSLLSQDKHIALACSYIIAKECATADSLARSNAALQRVLQLTQVWLQGVPELQRSIRSHIQFNWSGYPTVMYQADALEEVRCWEKTLEQLPDCYDHDRSEKVSWQLERITDAKDARTDFLELARKNSNLDNFSKFDKRAWVDSCYDPENEEQAGLLLECLVPHARAKNEMLTILQRISQFPGLKLAHGHLLNSHVYQIEGRKPDKSYLQDSLILLSVSPETIFITRDKSIIESSELVNLRGLVKTPEEVTECIQKQKFS
jgi:hypothetical protein